MYTTIYKVKFKTVGCLVYEMREVSFNGGYVIMETLDSVNIPIRKDETHKGDYGKILLIGGSANMGGNYACCARMRL